MGHTMMDELTSLSRNGLTEQSLNNQKNRQYTIPLRANHIPNKFLNMVRNLVKTQGTTGRIYIDHTTTSDNLTQ